MKFFPYEVEKIIDNFPPSRATIDDDLEDFEVEAVGQFGLLKNHVHMYLGLFYVINKSWVK